MRHAVIMAGGSGTRLWPLSRAARPKQLLDVVAGDDGQPHSLLREAFTRLRAVLPAEQIWVCTAAPHGETVRGILPEIGVERLILEPAPRDTANAVGLAAALIADVDSDAELAVVSADHVIRPTESFAASLRAGFECLSVRPRALVTLGIVPTGPATGFGYVQKGEAVGRGVAEVRSFREKPDRATAASYLAAGDYVWNSGMFVWRAQTILDELAEHLPATAAGLKAIVDAGLNRARVLAEVFPTLPKVSIDYAVLEPAAAQAGRVLVVDLDAEWLDVGSWTAIAGVLGTDAVGNATEGLTTLVDSSGNIVFSAERTHLIAAVGLRDCIVVHTADATMICPISESERVKELLETVVATGGERFR